MSVSYKIYGKDLIEQEALKQMETAMGLPVSQAGALMADAHSGYGLPIGGVLATDENVVIPYAVGVDIACRMCMSVFDLSPDTLVHSKEKLKTLLRSKTIFGIGATCKDHFDSSIFDRQEWMATKIIRSQRDKAYNQLGTSGEGNHFVEWGILRVIKKDELLNIPPGSYLALLSHSGSRGFGNNLATFYSRVAMEKHPLQGLARHLAWLELDSEEGQEYWIGMNLAGDYASANHHEIHEKISRSLGQMPLRRLENHHNFAWKEKLPDGRTAIIHRKGATPAGPGNIGIIPGSMTQDGYIVRGKGNPDSLSSASHGAGRVMSRREAFRSIDPSAMTDYLRKKGVDLIGGDVDEAPFVYKNLKQIMNEQQELVQILATFTPKIVRMAEPGRRPASTNQKTSS
ncbi:MAG: RtcB family protein [bacterium]